MNSILVMMPCFLDRLLIAASIVFNVGLMLDLCKKIAYNFVYSRSPIHII